MRFQPIYDIAEICARKGLTQAVLCPGSRCAPLILAFAQHPGIQTRTFSDERSAAFIALGISQQLGKPATLMCTSGTAVYNFAPAVAEAFFNRVPLVIITADRPSEWINQQDGQTIFQSGIFGAHVKQSYQLPQTYDHPDDLWSINRIMNEAINLAQQEPKGPVHINAPFREPLYPGKNEAITFSPSPRIMDEVVATQAPANVLQHELQLKNGLFQQRILIVAGQADYDQEIITAISELANQYNIPVIGDIISNLHPVEKLIKNADLFLIGVSDKTKEALKPDLLITFGKSVLSKNLKLFLRKYSSQEHWHIHPGGTSSDTFQHLSKIIHSTPSIFFASLIDYFREAKTATSQTQKDYFSLWKTEDEKLRIVKQNFFPQEGDPGEFEFLHQLIRQLPTRCNLHLANSMSVRYANIIALEASQKNICVFCNRGTSGIDGCTSTATGHALASDILNILITGDLAFFYDRNAFWHNYNLPNLRIVLLNNHGGVIFKMIDGPGELPEADEYFVTHQKLNAKKLCEEYGFEYLKTEDRTNLEPVVKKFFKLDGAAKVLEIETTAAVSKEIYDNFKQKIKASYEL